MEQIKIVFFALASFFGIEDGKIAADKTTVTIYPEIKKVVIFQENIFTVIQSENDSTLTLEQWNKIKNREERHIFWAKELDSFPIKKLVLKHIKKNIQPQITLSYSNQKDLSVLGIWYNTEKNQFSINQIPQYNIKTNDGVLAGNYWIFDGNSNFSFTLEPFLLMPEKYKKHKISITKL